MKSTAKSSAALFALAGFCVLVGPAWAGQVRPLQSAGKQNEFSVTYQINPAHSGSINFSAGFTTPLTKLWTEDLGSSLSYPVVADNLVFVNTSGGETYALELA